MPYVKRLQYTPILGWSTSRYDAFNICKRRYYYTYYLKYDSEFSTRTIAEMKDLVSVPMEIGSVTHEIISTLLGRLRKTTDEIDLDRFRAFALAEAGKSARTKTFHEVFYGTRDAVRVEDIAPKVNACLDRFLASERYAWLVTEAAEHRGDWVIEPPGYGETRIDGQKAYCKVDFLCPSGDTFYVIDWKTGKTDADKHRKQLTGYSLWATYHCECDASRVRAILAYLHPRYSEVEERLDADDLNRFAIQVRAETKEMYDYCRVVERNIPLDKDAFARVDDAHVCGGCNFRGLCFPSQYRPVAATATRG